MPQFRVLSIAVALLVLLGGTAMALFGADLLEARKEASLKTAMIKLGEPIDASMGQTARTSEALMGMEAAPDIAGALNIYTTGAPAFDYFAYDANRKLVIDFKGTVNLLDAAMVPVDRIDGIKAVRTSLFAVDPNPVSRVVLVLDKPARQVSVTDENDTAITVVFQDGGDALTVNLIGGAEKNPRMIARLMDSDARIDRIAERVQQLDMPIVRKQAAPGTERRLESMVQDLQAVADVQISLELNRGYSADVDDTSIVIAEAEDIETVTEAAEEASGQVVEETTEEVADTPPEEMAEEEPVPPAPREGAPAPDPEAVADSNEEIAQKMRGLMDGIGSGLEVLQTEEEIQAAETPEVKSAAADKAMADKTVETDPLSVEVAPAPRKKVYKGDPLLQPINLDCREMELANVVALLAYKAGINVIAGTDIAGTVTANLREVPLMQAMETVLRMNGLGIMEEEGIYYVVPYEEALMSERETRMIPLKNANSKDIRTVVMDIVKGSKNERLISISSDDTSNVVVISGPKNDIKELSNVIWQLDVSEQKLPTITRAIKLNYSDPDDVAKTVKEMLTKEVGTVSPDARARHIIVTDVPVVVEQVEHLVKSIDIPLRQVSIDTMIVDVTLSDEADTGVNWLMEAIRRQSTRAAIEDPGGLAVGNLQELSLGADLDIGDTAGLLSFGLLGGDFDWRGVIQAEVRNRNGHLVSNPVLVTLENEPARISISREIPFVELTQTQGGGQQTSTEFKEVGTVLEITPKVTHDKHIIVAVDGKESSTLGEFNGIPIEDKREVTSTVRMKTGQTIFVGGLRKNDDNHSVRKVPILGNVPVVNYLFRSTQQDQIVNELLIFLTCEVLEDEDLSMNGYQQDVLDDARNVEVKVDAEKASFKSNRYPRRSRVPNWEYRDR